MAMPEAPAPGEDEPHVGHLLLHELQRVDHRAQHDHRGAVLVVVEHRNVEVTLQALLDLEAPRGRDVLQVDAPENRRDGLDDHHDLVDVLGGQADREGVDAGELLEDERLAFHHRLRATGPDVAETEHRRAVGHHRHRVLLDGERVGLLRIVVDGHADARHARRVGHREIVARLHRHLAAHLDLAAQMHEEGAVGHVDDRDTFQRAQPLDDLPAMALVARLEGEIARDGGAADFDEVDATDVAAALADGGRYLAEHSRLVEDLQADRQAVTGRWSVQHGASPWANESGRYSPMPPKSAQDSTQSRRFRGMGGKARDDLRAAVMDGTPVEDLSERSRPKPKRPSFRPGFPTWLRASWLSPTRRRGW